MKLGGNLPPEHDALLFSISGTGSFIWPVAQRRLTKDVDTQNWHSMDSPELADTEYGHVQSVSGYPSGCRPFSPTQPSYHPSGSQTGTRSAGSVPKSSHGSLSTQVDIGPMFSICLLQTVSVSVSVSTPHKWTRSLKRKKICAPYVDRTYDLSCGRQERYH